MALALVDLDRTALSVNSATLWVRRQWREGRLSAPNLALAGWWLSLYRLGVMRVDNALHQAVASMEGQPEADLEERTGLFWREECLHAVRPGARRAVRWHKERGHRVVLCTSSSPWISKLALGELDLDGYLCTEIEVVDGALTGKIRGTPNFGDGKLTNLRRYAREQGIALEDTWFYTDSAADLPLMLEVGHPVCIAPDMQLAKQARKRGWPVEDWG